MPYDVANLDDRSRLRDPTATSWARVWWLTASAKVPARDLQEFLALARARPGQLG